MSDNAEEQKERARAQQRELIELEIIADFQSCPSDADTPKDYHRSEEEKRDFLRWRRRELRKARRAGRLPTQRAGRLRRSEREVLALFGWAREHTAEVGFLLSWVYGYLPSRSLREHAARRDAG
jgi:hypothetical protein